MFYCKFANFKAFLSKEENRSSTYVLTYIKAQNYEDIIQVGTCRISSMLIFGVYGSAKRLCRRLSSFYGNEKGLEIKFLNMSASNTFYSQQSKENDGTVYSLDYRKVLVL